MVSALDTHILTVDANVIGKIDTANPESLFYIWAVFSRCAPSVEQGRRLENLSWRLWKRETLRTSESRTSLSSASSCPKDIPSESRMNDLPQLSGSVDSVEEEAVEFTAAESAIDIKPHIHRQDSCLRDVAQPVKSDEFEKMVVSIITEKKPLTAPLPHFSTPATATAPTTTPNATSSTSSTFSTSQSPPKSSARIMSSEPIAMNAPPTSYIPTESIASPSANMTFGARLQQPTTEVAPSPVSKPTTVIRGFAPSTSIPRVKLPVSDSAEPVSITTRNPPKKSPMFTCGGSASSSEAGPSLSEKQPIKPAMKKRGMFQVGGSSAESSLKSGLAPPPLSTQKKTTSFSAVIDTIDTSDNDNDNAIATDSEDDDDDDDDDDDYMDESAIEDEDDEWEEFSEKSGKSSVDDRNYFQRVESKVNLTSRRSLITLMFNQSDNNGKNNIASQSTSALQPRRALHGPSGLGNGGPSGGPSGKMAPEEQGLMMKRAPSRDVSHARAQAQPILSPRTTRRNMLSTELTESLRRHMLWERKQKSKTANAVLERRHTSQDVANLRQYPTAPYMDKKLDDDKANWNRYFTKEAADGYHTKGW
ncbi:hypothetical protein TD95_000023 [Thielaviopsis punctulata]|uniref:Uncharacterized protein n=1 Tax=Thielaviopsis punctulata TaxID=72032 RepID=A0A0F4Z862_9PEZI|nr:hypothetical protein TD95_000023 [Thielaviopsis punctulata]